MRSIIGDVETLGDEELVARFRAEPASSNAQASINHLFERYHSRVAAWCYRFTGDRNSAVDLAQDIFLKAYRSLNSFRGDAKFSTWLFSIARNHCVNEMRMRYTRPEEATDCLDPDLEPARGESALAALQKEEVLRSMRALISETLDPTEAQVMTMHYAEDISLDAITRLLGLTNASGAKAYVVSAKRKLGAAVARWRVRQGRGGDR